MPELRILTLTPYPIDGASPRFRAYAFQAPLRRHGIRLDIRPFMTPATYHAWMETKRLTPRVAAGLGTAALGRIAQAISARRYDAIWVQRQTAPVLHRHFDGLFTRSGVPIVFDMDDAVFTEYPIDHLLRASRAATVGNRYLARYVQTVAPSTEAVVVPTVVDTGRYVPGAGPVGGPVVVGWIGSGASFRHYLAPVLENLTRTCHKHGAVFEVIASPDVREQVEAAGGRFVPWSLDGELDALRHFDIGVMPLRNDDFARGKCAFKLIEYGAVGVPSVGSRVGANEEVLEDGVTGFLAATPEEFSDRLVRLIRHPDLRERLGLSARRRITERYSLDAQTPVVADLFRRVVGRTGPT